MKATMRPRSSVRARRKPAALKPTKPYHHGSVHAAMLQAAERILERDGIQGLTLRAAAREAGVSHAAPKNHFGDLRGLLSELAAIGFERFRATMEAKLRDGDAPAARMDSIGLGYVTFARAHPGLFLLMFRSERLDFTRPALRAASDAAFAVLANTVAERRQESLAATLTLPQAAHIAAAWSLVHGFAMLLIDGRLQRLMARLPPGDDETTLLTAMFKAAGLPRG